MPVAPAGKGTYDAARTVADGTESEAGQGHEQRRRRAQLAFLASGTELEVGDPAACPVPVDDLAATEGGEPWVVATLSGGLTARVFRLRAGGGDWTLKRARVPCSVKNVDGQTSFLNELQRRADLEALKRLPGGEARWTGVVDTTYGSLRRGVLLSPWIDGERVASWDERRLRQLFAVIAELTLAGLFEWDLCPGNILDDGQQVRLFDFGYMYRFDPLRDFNSNGRRSPIFHPAERFETRNFSLSLLGLERSAGGAASLAAFRQEKEIALEAYERMGQVLGRRGAVAEVVDRVAAFATRWRAALRGDLESLYIAECWRSHRLDVKDDLHGQTCTPTTLARIAWLQAALRDFHGALASLDAFFWEDVGQPPRAIAAMLEAEAALARRWQVRG